MASAIRHPRSPVITSSSGAVIIQLLSSSVKRRASGPNAVVSSSRVIPYGSSVASGVVLGWRCFRLAPLSHGASLYERTERSARAAWRETLPAAFPMPLGLRPTGAVPVGCSKAGISSLDAAIDLVLDQRARTLLGRLEASRAIWACHDVIPYEVLRAGKLPEFADPAQPRDPGAGDLGTPRGLLVAAMRALACQSL